MPEETFRWKDIFIELALRALRRVHHDYQLWDAKQDWSSDPDLRGLNTGHGIEYAIEETVCAAITQEFIYSRYPFGAIFDGDQRRYYRIARERTYPGTQERVDIVVERIDPENNDLVDSSVFIEAKRAFRWPTKLCLDRERPTKQISNVKQDVDKLRKHREWRSGVQPFFYVLVWNVVDPEFDTHITPETFFEEVHDPAITIRVTRWAPLSWGPEVESSGCPSVGRWLWVCLAEV